MTRTVAKNRLPAKAPGKYFHKKNAAGDSNRKHRAKTSLLAKPILSAVKTVPADPNKGMKAYRRVHCSCLTSTGACNLR